MLVNISLSGREIGYYHNKNRCDSCLPTSQLKTQCLRELKIFMKIYEILRIKSKFAAG